MYFTFDVYITNKGDTKTFRTKNFKALVETKKKGFVETDVLTRKEYIEKKQKKQKLRNALSAVAAAAAADMAGTKHLKRILTLAVIIKLISLEQ